MNATDARRRWLGLFCLAVAFGMLVWGQTVLKPHLAGWGYLGYWFVCFFFTIAAIWIALLDVRAIRRRIRNEHRELIQKTLEEVESAPSKKSSRKEG
jgi:hypothetical protein